MKHLAYSLAALTTFTLTAPANAALSGYYNSVEQINVILSSPEVGDALRQLPIGMISNSGTRKDGAIEWTIRTQRCDLKVHLKAIPPKGIGKTTYEIAKIGTCK